MKKKSVGLLTVTASLAFAGLADGTIPADLERALAPICDAVAARRVTCDIPAPVKRDSSNATILHYLTKGVAGRLEDAAVAVNASPSADKVVQLCGRTFVLPPKGWVAISPDGNVGSMNVRLNRQRLLAGWCEDYVVWAKDGEVTLRQCARTWGVTVRALEDPRVSRKVGRSSNFEVAVRDPERRLFTNGTVTVWADNCGKVNLLPAKKYDLAKGNPFRVSAKADEACFLRLHARYERTRQHGSATVPYAPEAIRPGTPLPADFDAVWKADLAKAEATVPLDARIEKVEKGHYGGALDEYAVSFATTQGRRANGYMTVPKTASAKNKMGVVVTVVGAGSGATYAWDARNDSITLVLNVVDYLPTDATAGRDYAKMNAWAKARYNAGSYALAGWTASREEVFFHSQIIGLVRGLKWVAQRPEVDAKDFTYFGGSQGGGFGYAVVALSDGLFRKAFFYITAMSDMLRADVGGVDGWPCVRGGKLDEAGLAATLRNTPYFDSCSFAHLIKCPVRSTLGLEDVTCAPPNVMASFNRLASPDREIDFEPGVGHGITASRFASIYEWLRAPNATPSSAELKPLVSDSGTRVRPAEPNPWPMIFWERSRTPEILAWHEKNTFGKPGEVGALPPLKWYVNPKDPQAPTFLLLTLGDPAKMSEDALPVRTIHARHYSAVALDVSRWPDAATRAAAAIKAADAVRRDPRVPLDAVIVAGEGEAATAALWAMAQYKGFCGAAIKNEAAKTPVCRAALLAACAPRPIEVGLDLGLDTAEPYFRELVAASKAYPLFGVTGLDISVWPGDKSYVNRGGKIGFHGLKGRAGGLCRTDWMRWMDYYDWQGVRGLGEPLDSLPYDDLPDLLAKADGTKAKTAAEWERDCKARIKEFFSTQIYGKAPPRPADLRFTLEKEEPVLNGLGFRRTVRADFSGPLGKCAFHIFADLPASAKTKPAPGFVWLSYGPHSLRNDTDRRAILSRGYALVQFAIWEYATDYGEFAPERCDWASRCVFGCYEKASERKGDSWGCITAWAWGASRALDWMETQKELDAKHVGIVGLSRGGKTALWTGVSDPRFAMTCPCCSGCMGPRLHRLNNPPRETFWLLQCIQGFWFAPNAARWADHEEEMPWDMNALVACVAPRLLVVTDGCYDGGSGPVGGFHSARLASPAWAFYGCHGVAAETKMPTVPNTLVGDVSDPSCRVYVNYHLGGHATMTYDWNRFMDIADAKGWKR